MISQRYDTKDEMGRTHQVTRISRLLQLLAILMLLGVMAPETLAVSHGLCSGCGEFVVISNGGAGLNRDWRGLCGTCETHGIKKEFGTPSKPIKARLKQLGLEGVELTNNRSATSDSSGSVVLKNGVVLDQKTFAAAEAVSESFWKATLRQVVFGPLTNGQIPYYSIFSKDESK
jgi:hypothetical protein